MKQELHNQAVKVLQELTVAGLDKDYNEIQIPLGDALIVRDDEIILSAEHEISQTSVADYYGEHRGGYPWVNPVIENALDAIGCYAEWVNPGCLRVHAI